MLDGGTTINLRWLAVNEC